MDLKVESENEPIFSAWDYVILAVSMAASVAIGLYYRFTGGKQKTNEEYLLADRNMSILPVAVSVMASFISGVTLLGVSSENYYYGMQYAVINLGYAIATPIATQFYLPVFFGLQKTSAYEYLGMRFGPNLRLLASLTYTIQMLLYNGIVLYAPALVLEAVSNFNKLVSILVVGFVCIIYSTLGGMKAVLITDLLQSSLMFIAVFSVLIFSSIHVNVGGFTEIFSWAKEGGRLDFSSISPDPTVRHTWWSLLIGGMFTYLSLNAVNHTQVQRLLTVSSLKRSQACLWWALPFTCLVSLCTCFAGIGIYAVYRYCDPLVSGQIGATDQVMPFFVVNEMRSAPGLAGLFLAGIFNASLSTISSACNSLAAVTLHDFIKKWAKLSPSYETWVAKFLACGFGFLIIGMAFLAENLGGVLQAALTIFGAVGGPLFGVFTLGMFTTYANEVGASIGLLTGMAMTLWMSFGAPRPPIERLPLEVSGCAINATVPELTPINPSDYFYLYRISYLWTSPLGFVWVMIVGSLISLLWRQQHPWQKRGQTHPDPNLFTPMLAKKLKKTFSKEKIEDTSISKVQEEKAL